MLDVSHTIVAPCTAPGNAPRAVIRLSGPNAFRIARVLTGGSVETRGVRPVRFATGDVTFPGSVWSFPAPHSYTGDDVAELHLPGNALLVRWLIEDCLALGARHAEAGEFTARAFFAGKLTIDQAEGVAATIHAESAAELAAARKLLSGELSRRVAPLIDDTAALLALIEAGIDFSEEDVTFITPDETRQRLVALRGTIDQLIATSVRFDRLKHEPVVMLAGAANAGKSTLLNALAGSERVIVSPVAGTTRDMVSVPVRLARGTIKLTDSPGFESTTAGVVASAMRVAAGHALKEADVIVHVLDRGQMTKLPTNRTPEVVVSTKADLAGDGPAAAPCFAVSAHTGQGMNDLRAALDAAAFGTPGGGAGVTLNRRHMNDLVEAALMFEHAAGAIGQGGEHVAADLRQALDALGRMSGAVSPDDVIGRVFSSFCIGK